MSTNSDGNGSSSEAFFSREMVRGVPIILMSRVALFFIQFGISVVVVNKLGSEEYGLLSSAQAIAEFLLVACSLGLNTAIVRFGPDLHVKRNRAGLIRLIGRSCILQAGMAVLVGVLLWVFKPQFDAWYFKFDSGWLLLLVALFVVVRLARFLVEDAFTALLHVGTVAALSVLQSAIWLVLALVALHYLPTAAMGIAVQVAAAAVYSVVGGVLLFQLFYRLDWHSPSFGIGKRRVLKLSLASLLNTLGLMILQQYSVVFFLTLFISSKVAGEYRLGCETPLLAISFIPLAMRKLFTVGFSEAYARDEACLGRLISTTYRTLIIAVIPLACFGVFFAPTGLVLIYSEEMAAACSIAAIFCVLHVLALISMPVSMAIVAKEKILNMSPLTALQVAVNLTLNVLLIPKLGLYGGVAAVALTFVLTIPIRLYVVYRILGDIYFPMGFLLKIAVPMTVISALLFPLAPHLNLAGFFALGAAYLAVYPFIIRMFRLLHEDDIAELRAMNFVQLNRVLDFLVKA